MGELSLFEIVVVGSCPGGGIFLVGSWPGGELSL